MQRGQGFSSKEFFLYSFCTAPTALMPNLNRNPYAIIPFLLVEYLDKKKANTSRCKVFDKNKWEEQQQF